MPPEYSRTRIFNGPHDLELALVTSRAKWDLAKFIDDDETEAEIQRKLGELKEVNEGLRVIQLKGLGCALSIVDELDHVLVNNVRNAVKATKDKEAEFLRLQQSLDALRRDVQNIGGLDKAKQAISESIALQNIGGLERAKQAISESIALQNIGGLERAKQAISESIALQDFGGLEKAREAISESMAAQSKVDLLKDFNSQVWRLSMDKARVEKSSEIDTLQKSLQSEKEKAAELESRNISIEEERSNYAKALDELVEMVSSHLLVEEGKAGAGFEGIKERFVAQIIPKELGVLGEYLATLPKKEQELLVVIEDYKQELTALLALQKKSTARLADSIRDTAFFAAECKSLREKVDTLEQEVEARDNVLAQLVSESKKRS